MREGKRKKEHYSLVPRLSDTHHSEERGTLSRIHELGEPGNFESLD